jgi:hypothetical protein
MLQIGKGETQEKPKTYQHPYIWYHTPEDSSLDIL